MQQFTPLISLGLFLLIVPGRKIALDHNGVGLSVFLIAVLTLAFAGGVLFKGKSGWCTQFCPMLQIERFYGQSPLRVLPNSHCRPCVGCNKNCYDFNPTAAYLADLHDENPRLGLNRKMIAGAIPWVIAAFFTQPYLGHVALLPALTVYARLLIAALGGIGFFLLLETLTPFTPQQLVLGHVVAAINLFYWFGAPLALGNIGADTAVLPHLLQGAVAALSLVWLWRAWPREQAYLRQVDSRPTRVADAVLRVQEGLRQQRIQVAFQPGPTVLAKEGDTVLDIAEGNGVALQSGCRMGVCGADPVRVLSGAENLSPAGSAERGSLERLGLSAACRLACCARVQGTVAIALSTEPLEAAGEEGTGTPARPAVEVAEGLRRVVILGNGVAGVTATVELHKRHPDLDITLLGQESYDFYNRMAVDRLVAETTAIDKLYLMPKDWAQSRRIQYLPASPATAIDRGGSTVRTEDGQAFAYDRLILATGARSAAPAFEGFGLDGTFVLRTIDDAIAIQQHIRRRRCRSALVVGGGPLGLEAAHSMSHLGVRVTVLDRGPWPMARQLDEAAGTLLRQLMQDLGVTILPRAEIGALRGSSRVEEAELKDGRRLPVDLCLVAAGIQPITDLARDAWLAVNRGVVVDDRMTTSDPAIFAVGDVAEFAGRIAGLWPAGVEQGQIAAANILGGDRRYQASNPPVRLKVAGIDLLSIGAIAPPETGGSEIRVGGEEVRAYRKLVLADRRVQGAILIGNADLAESVTEAVEMHLDVAALLAALTGGDWSVLGTARTACRPR